MPKQTDLRVMSINVGRFLDRERTMNYLNQFKLGGKMPDVIMVQDVPERDLAFFQSCWPHIAFAPMTNHLINGERAVVGIAMCSRYPISNIVKHTYWGDGTLKDLQGINEKNERYLGEESDRLVEATEDRVLIVATVSKEGVDYQLATTHGMWTRGGVCNDVQLECIGKLSQLLDDEHRWSGRKSVVFVGDINAGRGTEGYRRLTMRLHDCVPENVLTTLDPSHPASKRGINVVTDFFMTPQDNFGSLYDVIDFRMDEGASDHKVISATVRKVQ